jgi:hypothetical protein
MALASAPPTTTLVPARPDDSAQPSPVTTLIVARPEGTEVPTPDNSTDTNSTTTLSVPAANPTATPDNSEGFSTIALEAALSGGLTPAKAPKFNNTIGLDIE